MVSNVIVLFLLNRSKNDSLFPGWSRSLINFPISFIPLILPSNILSAAFSLTIIPVEILINNYTGWNWSKCHFAEWVYEKICKDIHDSLNIVFISPDSWWNQIGWVWKRTKIQKEGHNLVEHSTGLGTQKDSALWIRQKSALGSVKLKFRCISERLKKRLESTIGNKWQKALTLVKNQTIEKQIKISSYQD